MFRSIIASISVVSLAFIALCASANPNTKSEVPNTTASTAAPAAASANKAELTVEGIVKKKVVKKKEIYLLPAGSDKKLEFYFPETAQFLKNNQPVTFDAIQEGQKVRVTYTQKGKRLNPSKAEILE